MSSLTFELPSERSGSVRDAMRWAQQQGLDRLEAQMLALHALDRAVHDRAWLAAHDDTVLNDAQQARFQAGVKRRLAQEPMAYITGEKEFFGLTLHVDARVLDPRPDTETLVDWALECMVPLATPRVVDLGTGSGAIALALQHSRPDALVHAVDASADALAVAQANATRLNLAVRFAHGDWLAPLHGQSFELIVSNPPYVAEGDAHLFALRHEPLSALTAGTDGLDDIRRIARDGRQHLSHNGWLLLEHGHDQADAVCALLLELGYAQVQSRTDLAGIRRCSGGQWPRMK
jgi:release factor glutamine methyltransferase